MNVTQEKMKLLYAPLGAIVFVGIFTVFILLWLVLKASDTRFERLAMSPTTNVQFDLKKVLDDNAYTDLMVTWEEDSLSNKIAAAAHPASPHETAAEKPEHKSDAKENAIAEFSENTTKPTPAAFPQAPIEDDLIEISPFGPLPKKGEQGEEPWKAYRAAFTAKKNYDSIALIIDDVGLSEKMTTEILRDFPKEVTLSFNPYAQQLDTWLAQARGTGHEALMGLPMEPKSYPEFDPGPKALMKDYSDSQNADALKWTMGRAAGYVGVMTMLGDAFTETPWRIDPILKTLLKRGVLFVDASSEKGKDVTQNSAAALILPFVRTTIALDGSESPDEMLKQLKNIEKQAKKNEQVVIVASPYPVVMSVLKKWVATLDAKKIQLAPISALAEADLPKE